MPLTLPAGDRKLLLISAVLITMLLLAAGLLNPAQEQSSVPSSYNAGSGGAKAAYLLLKESGYAVERWEQPPGALPDRSAGSLLILADPWHAERQDKLALQKFVVHGGRILATGPLSAQLLPEGASEPAAPGQHVWTWDKAQPAIPSALTRGGEISMQGWTKWKKGNFAHVVHYLREEDPVVVSYRFREGEVIWWAGSTPLTNAGLKESGNLQLFLNSVGSPSRIFWDEYFHGARPGAWSHISGTPVRWALAQAALFFLAIVFTYSRRSGPLRPLVEPSRLTPLEFVETLGGLYQSAQAAQVAVEVPYQRFQYLLAKRLGLPGRPSASEMAQAATQRLGYKRPEFAATLTRCERAVNNPDLKEKEAVSLVQALNEYARELLLVSPVIEEKN